MSQDAETPDAPFTVLVVTWEDAYSSESRRSRDFTRHKIEPCLRRTVGFLIREDEKYVVIAGEDDREAQEALSSDDDCDTVTVIPRAMIVKVEELSARRTRKLPGEND